MRVFSFMNVDRSAYDAAIKQLEVAKGAYKAYRTAYVKEVRDIGVELRKLFCNDDTKIGWIHNVCAQHPAKLGQQDMMGMKLVIDTASCSPQAVEAIKDYLTEHGWLDLRVKPRMHSVELLVY